MYQDTLLYIDGSWRGGSAGEMIAVINPATEEVIGTVAKASEVDLGEAVSAAQRGFSVWRKVPALDRAQIMRRASAILREREDRIARLISIEQGKPLYEALNEVRATAETNNWFAEEATRSYGRVIPARGEGIHQFTVREPVGPVAAFTPWNFPILQIVCKVSAALAAGCSVIVKAPEETPASPAELVSAFAEAGVPRGVVNLVFGEPSEISEYLISHPVIRKVSFTGSTAVGKQLASLAGLHMKRATMELGGHAPAIVFSDADLDAAVTGLSTQKFKNAGQVCISPTRFLIQESIFETFVERFVEKAASIEVGDGLAAGTRMGPLANKRRLEAIDAYVSDAVKTGGEIRTGGKRIGNQGYFYEPTVIANASIDALAMNEEPFGPIALVRPFRTFDDAVAEANRLPYGLAAYAYTQSGKIAAALGAALESGMVSINHLGLSLPETPFGGVKDSGVGSEGGTEGIDAYLSTKFISQV
ncbi:NAD-dependent succinate-semialdehyde dehydrogenase [Mesorhizobium sp. 1M-11]|uniref:NAD-dependent succinate-semialdehyde dehydrogenase n=1 Tax=Mesorhizobium sp. 1M-11 TaxID=1529006 RepID=UPI0006C74487|nr:NAD-dependent succinate-semialdehyde dehydrogenase [Mesorhizobium sp. 1M-11]